MNCCDRLLVLFLAFAFIEFQLRWERDEEVVREAWNVVFKGTASPLSKKSGSYVLFTQKSVPYGRAPVEAVRDGIISKDRSYIKASVFANITGPPLSFHRIILEANGVEERDMSIFTSPLGYGSNHMSLSLVHAPSSVLRVKYYFDDTWDLDDISNAHVLLSIESMTHSSVWDVSWSDVYIPKEY